MPKHLTKNVAGWLVLNMQPDFCFRWKVGRPRGIGSPKFNGLTILTAERVAKCFKIGISTIRILGVKGHHRIENGFLWIFGRRGWNNVERITIYWSKFKAAWVTGAVISLH